MDFLQHKNCLNILKLYKLTCLVCCFSSLSQKFPNHEEALAQSIRCFSKTQVLQCAFFSFHWPTGSVWESISCFQLFSGISQTTENPSPSPRYCQNLATKASNYTRKTETLKCSQNSLLTTAGQKVAAIEYNFFWGGWKYNWHPFRVQIF